MRLWLPIAIFLLNFSAFGQSPWSESMDSICKSRVGKECEGKKGSAFSRCHREFRRVQKQECGTTKKKKKRSGSYKACEKDAQRLCRKIKNRLEIRECLQNQIEILSPECKPLFASEERRKNRLKAQSEEE